MTTRRTFLTRCLAALAAIPVVGRLAPKAEPFELWPHQRLFLADCENKDRPVLYASRDSDSHEWSFLLPDGVYSMNFDAKRPSKNTFEYRPF